MLLVKVKHRIGDIVKNTFNDNQYRVIGYNYTPDRTIYICQQWTKDERVYLTDIELEWVREYSLWFTTK